VLIIGFSALIIFQIGFGKDVGRFEDSFKQISFDKFSLAYDSDDRAEEEKEEGEYGGKMEERKRQVIGREGDVRRRSERGR